MKKLGILLLLFCMFSFVGCAGQNGDGGPSDIGIDEGSPVMEDPMGEMEDPGGDPGGDPGEDPGGDPGGDPGEEDPAQP